MLNFKRLLFLRKYYTKISDCCPAETIRTFVFWAEIFLSVTFIVSFVNPQKRLWPPESNWHKFWVTSLALLIIGLILILGINDFNTFIYHHWSRFIPGIPLFLLGGGFFVRGVKNLSVKTSVGNTEQLVIDGVYQYSRNPQALGLILFCLGYWFISNSLLLLFPVTWAIALLIFVPFVEEPWIRKQYGEGYDEYLKKIPRFIKLNHKA